MNYAANRRHTIGGSYNGYGFAAEEHSEPSPWCTASSGAEAVYKDKPRKRHTSKPDFSDPWILVSIFSFFVLVWAIHSRAQRAWILKEMQVQSFPEAIKLFHTIKTQHRDAHVDLEEHYSLNEKLYRRDKAWKEQVELLQNATKKESHRAVVDKFGPGPHHVQIELQFGEVDAKDVMTFEIELAPLKLTPHAVHVFLEQVSHGLWNNSLFHLNHAHVLQIGPATKEHRQIFRDYELDRLAFPEYSDVFPHKKWSIGYAGRPGGPSWYINKIDNRLDHGPYGQEHHVLTEFADPCFAKVIRGYNVLERVFQDHTKSRIVSAAIINWEDHWTRDDEEDWRKEHHLYAESGDWDSDDEDYEDWGDEDDDHSGDRPDHHGETDHPRPELLSSYYANHVNKNSPPQGGAD